MTQQTPTPVEKLINDLTILHPNMTGLERLKKLPASEIMSSIAYLIAFDEFPGRKGVTKRDFAELVFGHLKENDKKFETNYYNDAVHKFTNNVSIIKSYNEPPDRNPYIGIIGLPGSTVNHIAELCYSITLRYNITIETKFNGVRMTFKSRLDN